MINFALIFKSLISGQGNGSRSMKLPEHRRCVAVQFCARFTNVAAITDKPLTISNSEHRESSKRFGASVFYASAMRRARSFNGTNNRGSFDELRASAEDSQDFHVINAPIILS